MKGDGLFEGIMNQSGLIGIATGLDDRIIYVSPLMCKALGASRDCLIGKTWDETRLPLDLVNVMNINAGLVRTNKVPSVVELDPQQMADRRTYECCMSPIINEDGELECICTVFTDVTTREELKVANYYIDQILRKLQSSNDIDNAIPKVLTDVAALFNADICTILFRQDEQWYPKYTYGLEGGPKDAAYMEEHSALAHLVQRTKDVYVLNDRNDGYFVKKMTPAWGIHLMMAIPLHIQGDVFGIMTMAYRSPVRDISSFQKSMLKKVASVISLAFSEDRYIWSREGEVLPSKRYLDMLNVGVALIDGKDRSVKWSNALYNSVIPVTYRGANITQMSYYRLSSLEIDTGPEEVFGSVVSSGEPMVYGCLQERNQSGVLKYWQVVFIPIPSKKHVPDVLNLVVDVTEWESTNKKNARLIHAIQEEQYRVRTLLDAVPVGVYISDAEGQILEINSMGSKIWGDNPLPRNLEEYGEYEGFWPDSGDRLKADDWPLAKAVRRGETTIGEVIDYKNFNGRYGTVINSAAPIKNRYGRVIGAVEIDQDITQMKALERSLEATKANLEAIINQMPAGVAIAEAPSGRITNCNNALRSMFPANMGLPSSIESYPRWGMLSYDDMRPLTAEEHPLAIALRERRTVSGYQAAIRKPNGDLITILTNASPVVGKDDKLRGAVAIFTDISHQKDIERTLEKQTKDLARFNADLQRFAYVTSNELRESLKSITNYLNLIEKNSS